MKKILTLLVIALSAVTAASAQQASKNISAEKKSVMIYSEEDEALVYKNGSSTNGKEILIESLPGYGSEPIPVDINPNENGSYTIKKHPSLILPDYYTVVITDSLTGRTFDLKAADSYTFDVAKATPDRFVLQMSKSRTTLTAMR